MVIGVGVRRFLTEHSRIEDPRRAGNEEDALKRCGIPNPNPRICVGGVAYFFATALSRVGQVGVKAIAREILAERVRR